MQPPLPFFSARISPVCAQADTSEDFTYPYARCLPGSYNPVSSPYKLWKYSETAVTPSLTKYCFMVQNALPPTDLKGNMLKCYNDLMANLYKISIKTCESECW